MMHRGPIRPIAPGAGHTIRPAVNVLALYDINGNIDALEAVLADPRATDPDVVVVGGDAVPGPFARATPTRLEALSRRAVLPRHPAPR
jgi:hypothetical protein